MLGKRSNRKNVLRFYCPKCDHRLWRAGSSKYFLFYTGALEIQKHVKMPHRSALLLAGKGIYVDCNSWIEEFICSEHGTLWMKLNKKN